MNDHSQHSPCLNCPKGMDPAYCEDKRCSIWRKWFLSRWERLHQYPRLVMEYSVPVPLGIPLGGRHYAAPHQVRAYLETDPCKRCACSVDLCTAPCRVRRAWDHAVKEVLQ